MSREIDSALMKLSETALRIADERNQLLAAMEPLASAARSWHDFHHGAEGIQCDDICAALPAAEAAIKFAREGH